MSEQDKPVVDEKRRQLLKISAGAVAGVGVIAGAGSWVKNRVDGVEQDDFPVETSPDIRPMDQRNVLLTFAISQALAKKHPDRNLSFSEDTGGPIAPGEKPFNFQHGMMRFATAHTRADNNRVGYTQLDYSLEAASWWSMDNLAPSQSGGVPNSGVFSWDQSDVVPHKYPFKDSVEKVCAIKTAAKTFGAVRVGICRRDKRWDYDPLYDVTKEETLTWEEDFPFEPKTVIVMLTEMDYEAMATAPMIPASATAAMGYTNNTIQAGAMAKFLRGIGYQAVGSGNDMGSSVAYAIAAGLGEGARNGTLIAPTLGPRVRISKVYTDLELDDAAYDKPRNFGIMEFCEHCKRCAESCPSQAISMDDKPSMGPTYPGSEDPEYAWQGQPGMRKFYSDSKKCFKFWAENGGDCGACIASCPWNKPDFWHHRLIDGSNAVTSGVVHTMMKQADILFGYGNVNDEEAVIKFWRSGFDGDFT
ncbi:reductive dehalogenase [Photobacterium sagamiensis]|uniref:reductive dehalogenase n=1 Tax=Photobacterium sagamiensis TaxID=2910241 RepID=UPI003D1072AF